MAVKVAILRMHIHLPGSDSLKAKRRRLKPLLARLHSEFNISASEVDMHEKWADALIGCALIGTDTGAAQRTMENVSDWLEKHWPDVDLMGEEIEIIQ